MNLTKLEIYGFKSFAENVEFSFDSGITVFCGPNGCGKSNVVDAIRWILGEQRAKSLRGKEMQEPVVSRYEKEKIGNTYGLTQPFPSQRVKNIIDK